MRKYIQEGITKTRELTQQEFSVKEIAGLIGVSPRTVYRINRDIITKELYQILWAKKLKGKINIKLKSGNADIVTDKKVYVVEKVQSWRQAIEQAIVCAEELKLLPEVILFGPRPKEKLLNTIRKTAKGKVKLHFNLWDKAIKIPGRQFSSYPDVLKKKQVVTNVTISIPDLTCIPGIPDLRYTLNP